MRGRQAAGAIAAFLAAALAGCARTASYVAVDEDTPADRAARVVMAKPREGGALVFCVDGRWFLNYTASNYGVSEVVLAPGRHYLGIAWMRYGGVFNPDAYQPLWFEAAPGGSYVASAAPAGSTVEFRIADAGSGAPVGAAVGSEPEPAGQGRRCIQGEKTPEQIAQEKKEAALRSLQKLRQLGYISAEEYQKRLAELEQSP